MNNYKTGSSNIIVSDYPDPDVIRVDDTYYMVSTTMHFMPGCVILRSYNLLDWEFCSYVYDQLEFTQGQTLMDNRGVYGKGMWAASLNYHEGKFYVSFVANDTHKSYLFTADSITGPWTRSEIDGFYHDMSLFWDDDGRVYVVHGNMNVRLTELEPDLSGPKKGGINKVIIQDDPEKSNLGYEGSHLYKINGRYYNFMIHIPKGKMRTEACFVADQIEGPWTGGDVLCSDLGNWNSGVAQGGIVQDKEGKWFGILFQDHGALGRIPVLVPVEFNTSGVPVNQSGVPEIQAGVPEPVEGPSTTTPATLTVLDNRPGYNYAPLWSNDFTNPAWQWNHIPDKRGYELDVSRYSIETKKKVVNITQAANTLTQRTLTEKCEGTVKLDASQIGEGDFAGLAALEGEYGFIAVTKRDGKYYLVVAEHKSKNTPWAMGVFDTDPPDIKAELPLKNPVVELKLHFDLTRPQQKVWMSYRELDKKGKVAGAFEQLGSPVQLRYTLDQFVGVRFALFCYSTAEPGGKAVFTDFNYSFW
ncbi:MAG: family 43 glycosylhydrolase [Treponema sp.]|nr:family 43 glycosylhydrolase [Treponema sp.]